ncbi:MAG: hypothetical protein IJV98_01750 [Clostridia bacterium]|nr:hypothetical protein [Clostridia bacterium]
MSEKEMLSGMREELTLVAIPCTLGTATDGAILDRLEEHALIHPERTLFAIVTTKPRDAARYGTRDALTAAENRIRALNERYGTRFALFICGGACHDDRKHAELCITALHRYLTGDLSAFSLTRCEGLPLHAIRAVVCVGEDIVLPIGAVRALADAAVEMQAFLRPRLANDRGHDERLSPFLCGVFPVGCPTDHARNTDAVTLIHTPARSVVAYYARKAAGAWTYGELIPSFLIARLFLGGALGELASLGALTLLLLACILCRRLSFLGMAYEAYLGVRRLFPICTSHETRKEGADGYLLRFSPSAMIGLLLFCLPTLATRLAALLWIFMPLIVWHTDHKRKSKLCACDRKEFAEYTREAWEGLSHTVTENGLMPNVRSVSPTAYTDGVTSPETTALYLLSALCARDLDYASTRELLDRCLVSLKTLTSLYKWNGCPFEAYHTKTLAPVGDRIGTASCGLFLCALTALREGLRDYVCEEARLSEVIGTLDELIDGADLSPLYDEDTGRFRTGYHVSRATWTDEIHEDADEGLLAAFLAHAKHGVPFPPFTHTGAYHEQTLVNALFLPIENALPMPHLCRLIRRQSVRVGKTRLFGRGRCTVFAFDKDMHYLNEQYSHDTAAPYVSFLLSEYDPDRAAENLHRFRALGLIGTFGFYDAIDTDASRVGRAYGAVRCYRPLHVSLSLCAVAPFFSERSVRERLLRAPILRAFRYVLYPPLAIRHVAARKTSSVAHSAPRYESIAPCPYTLTHPDAALLSNHKTKLIASSSGHLLLSNEPLLRSSLAVPLYDDAYGLRIYIETRDGRLPTVPLGRRADGISSTFSFTPRRDVIVYASRHVGHGRAYGVTLSLCVLPDREILELSVSVSGDTDRACVLVLLPPWMTQAPAVLGGISVFSHKNGVVGISGNLTSGVIRHPLERGAARLQIGFAEDAEALDFMMETSLREASRERKQKWGMLADLRYAASGLCRPVTSPERYLLRSFLFGEIRPRTETTCRFRETVLTRFDLTHDTPLVLARHACATTPERIRELCGIFRYMRIRGVRFDLILLCPSDEAQEAVAALICHMGCEDLGVRAVAETSLQPYEQFALDVTASAVFDLRFSLREQAEENPRAIPIREELIVSARTDTTLCQSRDHVLLSRVTGTVLTEHSLGYTYARDACLGRLTSPASMGERLLLRIYDGRSYKEYDLCADASKTEYGFGFAVYRGAAGGVTFRLSVTLTPHLGIKALMLSLRADVPRRCAVLYAVRPTLGEAPSSARVYRYRREKNGLLVSRFSENEAGISEMLVFSTECVTLLTEEAALLSDGKIFRGESDMAILRHRMTLTGEQTLCFGLTAILSEAHRALVRRLSATELLPSSLAPTEEDKLAWERRYLFLKLRELLCAPRHGGICVLARLLQDAFTFLSTVPAITKQALLRAAAHQYEEGDLQSRWYPAGCGVRRAEAADTRLFLEAIKRYLAATGDRSLLTIPVPYLSSPPLDRRERERAEAPSRTPYRESIGMHLARARRWMQTGNTHTP